MPTYEYSCVTCQSHFEFEQSFSEDTLTKCPGKRKGGPVTEACTTPGKGKVNKVFSAVGIAFKGDGFYKNDHGAGAKSKKASSASESSGSDSGSSDSSSSSSSSADSSSSSSDTKKSDSAKSETKKSDAKKSDAKKADKKSKASSSD